MSRPPAASISCLTRSAFSWFRAAKTTKKSFLANAWAVALPTPSVAHSD